jgi:SOS-response transcriptional repressor LexA
MLKGKELGNAIRAAIDRKVESGSVKSISEVARHFGVRPPSVYGWIGTGTIGKDKLPELWSYFSDVVGPEHWGLSAWPSPTSSPVQVPAQTAAPLRGRVPVISSVRAGDYSEIVDNLHPGDADEWIEVSCQVMRHTFALVVEGDSMEPEFTEGMRVVVEPDLEPRIGDYVVAGNGDRATLKKLVRDGDELYLKPLNSHYPTKPLGDGRIIGVVREAHRKYR